jgi:hypothetical protein
MHILNPRFLPEKETLELAGQGVIFTCPICLSKLKPIPSTWKKGEKVAGLICHNEGNHLLVYGDETKKYDLFSYWIERVSNP